MPAVVEPSVEAAEELATTGIVSDVTRGAEVDAVWLVPDVPGVVAAVVVNVAKVVVVSPDVTLEESVRSVVESGAAFVPGGAVGTTVCPAVPGTVGMVTTDPEPGRVGLDDGESSRAKTAQTTAPAATSTPAPIYALARLLA